MASYPRQKLEVLRTTNASLRLLICQKLLDLLPPMWRGNNEDMPLLTHNRLWFLRESRFLFFTRNGPVEITLKPTFVLATAVIGVVGISVILFSTIFASYSAIEVIRDESIQTAEAGVAVQYKDAPNSNLVHGTSKPIAIGQNDLKLHPKVLDDGIMFADKIVSPTNPVSQLSAQQSADASSLTEFPDGKTPILLPLSPEVITGESSREKHKEEPLVGVSINSKSAQTTPIDQKTGEIFSENYLDMELALADPLPQSPILGSPSDSASNKLVPEPASTAFAIQISPQSPEVSKTKFPNLADDQNSFVRTAAGFAISMLPRFLDPSNTFTENRDNTNSSELGSDDDTETGLLDDGFAISAYAGKAKPLLPSISDSARAKKMLLSLQSEIDYIRTSITQLGIRALHLPDYEPKKKQAVDTDFKQLLITLAEHRATLRKIPFKTPMLYFYISSDYGYRKHPKTGKRAFHHGIDLAGTWQENVRSTAPGNVVFAGREGSFGKVVRIEHEFGISTLYAHLARITVNVGDYVAENAVIGKMGNTGRSAGAHLHYEIQIDGQSVDPNDFFTVGRQMSVAGELRQTTLTN